LAGKCKYIGKVASDNNGKFYTEDLNAAGVVFDTQHTDGQTGTCVVLTTPDAERSMQTNLAVSRELSVDDINLAEIGKSQIVYIEGYLWDAEKPKAACVKSMKEAKNQGITIAFTFSDPFLLRRSGNDFRKLTSEYVDIVFCNKEEAEIFAETDDIQSAIRKIGECCTMVYVTLGGDGVLVLDKGEIIKIPGLPVKAIDTNGAGDMFAAGALYGLTQGFSPKKSASIANRLAAEIVQTHGPRLNKNLKDIIREFI
jgi:sugar/nucleoside kinase (ribokinase family)